MSDSSEEEDLSHFREAVDTSFAIIKNDTTDTKTVILATAKSDRYLDVSTHYNDVKVPEVLQKQIGSKISNIIDTKFEFVEIEEVKKKKKKVKGGVKLFKDSANFLSCEDPVDNYTELHNTASKKLKQSVGTCDDKESLEKIKAACVDGEYILNKEETKFWKSRRREKLFKYKKNGKSKFLIAVD